MERCQIMLLLLYILGCIATYIFLKWIRKDSTSTSWGDIFFSFIMSFSSWVGFLILLLIFGLIILFTADIWKRKPPKWL